MGAVDALCTLNPTNLNLPNNRMKTLVGSVKSADEVRTVGETCRVIVGCGSHVAVLNRPARECTGILSLVSPCNFLDYVTG